MRKVWTCPCGTRAIFPSDVILPGTPCCGNCGNQMDFEVEPGPGVDEMRRLATDIVSGWNSYTLIDLAATTLVKRYMVDNDLFEADKEDYWEKGYKCIECKEPYGTNHKLLCRKRGLILGVVVSDDCNELTG